MGPGRPDSSACSRSLLRRNSPLTNSARVDASENHREEHDFERGRGPDALEEQHNWNPSDRQAGPRESSSDGSSAVKDGASSAQNQQTTRSKKKGNGAPSDPSQMRRDPE
jgi:hypothetical protein